MTKRRPVVLERPREGESEDQFADRFAKKFADKVADEVIAQMNKIRASQGKPPLED